MKAIQKFAHIFSLRDVTVTPKSQKQACAFKKIFVRKVNFNERELAIVNYFTEEMKTLCEVAEKEEQ